MGWDVKQWLHWLAFGSQAIESHFWVTNKLVCFSKTKHSNFQPNLHSHTKELNGGDERSIMKSLVPTAWCTADPVHRGSGRESPTLAGCPSQSHVLPRAFTLVGKKVFSELGVQGSVTWKEKAAGPAVEDTGQELRLKIYRPQLHPEKGIWMIPSIALNST